jgi:acyl transferase domain-containing protein
MKRKQIAIIGISCKFPQADTLEQFYENLKVGKDSVRELSRERMETSTIDPDRNYQVSGYLDRVDLFDHAFFNLSRKDASYMEPSQRHLLELSVKAIENAGYSLESLSGSDTGVFIGIPAATHYRKAIQEYDTAIETGNLPSLAAGRIAYHLDLRGPAITIDTACSSTLVAIHP